MPAYLFRTCIAGAVLVLVMVSSGTAEEGRGDPQKRRGGQEVFLTGIPEYKGNIILGRPSDHSVTISILMHYDTRIRIAYGSYGKGLTLSSFSYRINAGKPIGIVLTGLKPDSEYEYRVLNADSGEPALSGKSNGSFRTCRKKDSSFIFTVQSDSHLDGNCLPELYRTCLENVRADRPDFHIDLGDTFMTGKHASRETASLQYAAQRWYLGLAGDVAPVFLVLGNHDGEEVFRRGSGAPDGLAVWSCLQRKHFFPNPQPDGFYTGNTLRHPHAGLLQDNYAWTWGDALFMVLDPYWTSASTRGGKEPWNMTLGKAQYDWVASTLKSSGAKYRFIFIHQLTGGLDRNGRGGVEAAGLYEWGGHEKDGRNTFSENRPGWEKPIHRLLADNKVTIVFHGHDHFFAKQELDGVIYQLVPQPCQRNGRNDHAQEYGYVKGVFLPGSGHIRVRVSTGQVSVDYVRTSSGQDGIANGKSCYSYICGIN